MKFLSVLLSIFCCFGFPAVRPKGDTREIPVLMYHSVCSLNTNDYILSPAKFESDIKGIVARGYEPVFFSEIDAFLEGGDLPEKPVVITFDDGFYNNLSIVLPIAQRYNVKCQLNIVGKYVEDGGDEVRSNAYSYLTSEEIKTLRETGLFEIGNHSFDMHRRDRRLGVSAKKGESDADYEAALTKDSEKCREKLLGECGVETRIFALPFGFYSKPTVAILGKLGYRFVLTCEEGVNKISRGQTGVQKIKRYNRPNRYSTEQYLKRCGIV